MHNCCSKTTVVAMPQGPHVAKLECAECGKFIKWLPKSSGGYMVEISEHLEAALLKYPHDNFVKSLGEQFSERGFLTQRQMECLRRIAQIPDGST